MRALSEIGHVLGDLVNPPAPLVPLKEILKLAMEEQRLRLFDSQKDLIVVAGLVFQKIRAQLVRNRSAYQRVFGVLDNVTQVAQVIHPFTYFPRISGLIPPGEIPAEMEMPSTEHWVIARAFQADQAVKGLGFNPQSSEGPTFAAEISHVIAAMKFNGLIRVVRKSPGGYACLTDKITPLLV